jgi:hypothetical protein
VKRALSLHVSHLRQRETRTTDAHLRLCACALKFHALCILSQHLAKFPKTSICHHLYASDATAVAYRPRARRPRPQPRAPDRATVLDTDPNTKHATVDSKHAAAILYPGLEHAVIDCKHVATFLDPSPEHAAVDLKHATTIIDLKPIVVDLATIVLPSLPNASPLLIVNAC